MLLLPQDAGVGGSHPGMYTLNSPASGAASYVASVIRCTGRKSSIVSPRRRRWLPHRCYFLPNSAGDRGRDFTSGQTVEARNKQLWRERTTG
ncbi:hypothetical protein MCOR25_009423 [Pyricularia grisea]|nr:hypothetical protein MCOR25_009423 [Pyricularia grisea]